MANKLKKWVQKEFPNGMEKRLSNLHEKEKRLLDLHDWGVVERAFTEMLKTLETDGKAKTNNDFKKEHALLANQFDSEEITQYVSRLGCQLMRSSEMVNMDAYSVVNLLESRDNYEPNRDNDRHVFKQAGEIISRAYQDTCKPKGALFYKDTKTKALHRYTYAEFVKDCQKQIQTAKAKIASYKQTEGENDD